MSLATPMNQKLWSQTRTPMNKQNFIFALCENVMKSKHYQLPDCDARGISGDRRNSVLQRTSA